MRGVSECDYYVICLKLHFKKLFIIWISDDVDGVLLNESLKIMAFSGMERLEQFALNRGLTLKPDLTAYDVAQLQNWLIEPNANFNGELFLTLWNLFIDVTESLKVNFLGDNKNAIRNVVYDKLFDIAGPFIAQDPNPIFNKEEVKILAEIMHDGLNTLLNNLFIT